MGFNKIKDIEYKQSLDSLACVVFRKFLTGLFASLVRVGVARPGCHNLLDVTFELRVEYEVLLPEVV
jgi:hypothetical protein